MRRDKSAAKIQRQYRKHKLYKLKKDQKNNNLVSMVVKVQTQWRKLVQRKKDARGQEFMDNIHRVILVQRVVKKMKANRNRAKRAARKRSAQFRWELVQGRFRDAVGTDSVLKTKAFAAQRRMRNRSTVFLHNPLEFEEKMDCELMHAGNYKVGNKSAHMKVFAAQPDSEAHSAKTKLPMQHDPGIELILAVTYYSDPNSNHMIRIAECDLQAMGALPWDEADDAEREELCSEVCTMLSADDNSTSVTSLLRDIQKRYMLDDNELNSLSRSFRAIDADSSGQIDVPEFCTYFGLDGHRQYWLSRKAFRMFDTDGSGDIDQVEYICGVMEYCAMDFHTLANFAFELFDEDGDGTIDERELESGLSYIHNTTTLPNTITVLLSELKFPLPSATFKQYQREYPALLLPAYKMQVRNRHSLARIYAMPEI
jgi:Ca2+-binding EF-hand superfamily protein